MNIGRMNRLCFELPGRLWISRSWLHGTMSEKLTAVNTRRTAAVADYRQLLLQVSCPILERKYIRLTAWIRF